MSEKLIFKFFLNEGNIPCLGNVIDKKQNFIEYMTNDMKLNLVLENLLRSRKMSLTKLSQATGVPIQTIHNWINGQSPHNIDHLKKIACHFDVSIDFLCFGDRTNTNDSAANIIQFEDEINAGVFEVVLRRVGKSQKLNEINEKEKK